MAETDTTDFGEAEREAMEQLRLLETATEEQRVEALRALLQDERVRDLLWHILVHCNVYAGVYNRNFGDMALAEGTRQVGLWLLSEICEADPDAEMRMRRKAILLEHARKARERQKRQRRQS